jgi:DNA primase
VCSPRWLREPEHPAASRLVERIQTHGCGYPSIFAVPCNLARGEPAHPTARSFGHTIPGGPVAEDRAALIRQVKDANDIVEVVGSYLSLRPAGQTYKGLCPFHDDHTPSLTVDPRWQNYRCWACGKFGDVISFVQEYDRVTFWEAVELLARRAGISLEKVSGSRHESSRAGMFEVVRWAAELYHQCLLDDPAAEAARRYLGERQLTGETVRRFGLGFAPGSGEWLVSRAVQAKMDFGLLEQLGLVGRRQQGEGYYDRFRDRVLFPIRDVRGRAIAFSGRILPSSPLSERAPKYYNSQASPLFNKGEVLYGLDQARQAGSRVGYLAVVEGYTDVLMAHQLGVSQVVATMGTALTVAHVQQLRRFVPRVVLVFDADAGGETGVERALELFVSHDVDLRIATLPEGLDPCDFLMQQGAEAFEGVLTNAVDVLEFRLNQVWTTEAASGIEGRRRAVDAILSILALAPEQPGQDMALKRELMVTRVAQRLGVKEETVWGRLQQLQQARRQEEAPAKEEEASPRTAPAAPHERQLLEVLLAEPALVPLAAAEVPASEVEHPGLRLLLEGLYRLQAEGLEPSLDRLRTRIDNPPLMAKAFELQEVGRANTDRRTWLRGILDHFAERRALPVKQELRNQLHATSDHAEAVELLRRLQNRTG